MNEMNRIYACKNEELVPLSKFTLFSLKRDIAEFSAFSPKFAEQYVTETEAMINVLENLLEPKAETLSLQLLYQTMEQQLVELAKLLLHVEGYLKLMPKATGISALSFGLTPLRKSLYRSDYEAVIKGLKVLLSNMQNQATAMQDAGMPTTMTQKLQATLDSLAENKQKQFEIKSNRANLVQNNQQTLNEMYLRLSEIYNIGKVIYKNTNPAKYAEYTFNTLLKKVRNTSKKSTTQETTSEATI